MAAANDESEVRSRSWRPPLPTREHRALFRTTAWDFEGRPRFSVSVGDDGTRETCVSFHIHDIFQCSVNDMPGMGARVFANKATALYSYRFGVSREHQWLPSFELWSELTAGLNLAKSSYRHYPVAPVFWSSDDGPPALLDVIHTHQALARRVKEKEGEMTPIGSGPETDRMLLRDPFGRCFIWCNRIPPLMCEREVWLVAEKRLVGNLGGEEVEGSGDGGLVWMRKKMRDVKEALQLILHLPEEVLETNPFRIRWDEMNE